jgi:CRISPR-associated protein Cas1
MNISIIDKKDVKLAVKNNTIKFGDTKLPLKLTDTLIITSDVAINAKDLIKLTNSGVTIIFTNLYTHKSTITSTIEQKNADLKLKQYQALKDRLTMAKYIVAQKIKRHTFQLKINGKTIEDKPYIKKIEEAKDMESLLGIEGSFSREYFQNYFSLFSKRLHSGKRTKRPPKDPLNALLSYFYTLLYSIVTVRLLAFGFDPSISYLHTPFRSHQALSSDIMELFRDQVNQFVKIVIDEDVVTLEDFSRKNGGVYLRYSGRKNLYKPLKDLWSGLEPKISSEIANLRATITK